MYLRYARNVQNVKIEVGTTSPRLMETDRQKYFPFSRSSYEIDEEYVFDIDATDVTSLSKQFAARIKEISGVGHHTTDLFWIRDDESMKNWPRQFGYLPAGEWPLKGESAQDAKIRAEKQTSEEIIKVYAAFQQLVGELNAKICNSIQSGK